jgi:tRNA U34 5-methylaminomethyl-2-thiouridine-forming methyltransferase MnmC
MQITKTKDGSDTIFVPELDEHYHSVNGAITESIHVFIKSGLGSCEKRKINLFEVGFGTGLNALLTWLEIKKDNKMVNYHGIELHPLDHDFVLKLNYTGNTGLDISRVKFFQELHATFWNKKIKIDDSFTLHKIHGNIHEVDLPKGIDIVYFDAFSPDKQPDMWKEDVFKKLFIAMNYKGILTSYSAKGEVKRTLKKVGFFVEKLPGPPGKREMIRAIKL